MEASRAGEGTQGATVREARVRSGLAYAEFARRLGVSKSSISRYESGCLQVPRKVELAIGGLSAELRAAAEGR